MASRRRTNPCPISDGHERGRRATMKPEGLLPGRYGTNFMPTPMGTVRRELGRKRSAATADLSSANKRLTAASADPSEDDEWRRLKPTEAAARFIDHNPRTGGADGRARKKGSTWTAKTREQFKLPALLLEQLMEGRPLAQIRQKDLLELNKCFNGLHGPSFCKSERQRAMPSRKSCARPARW